MGSRVVEIDPYNINKIRDFDGQVSNSMQNRRCCSDCKHMMRSSFRFYLFTLLIALNLVNFIGDFIFMNFSTFLIMRSCIIVVSATIFQITIIFMIWTSSENLSHRWGVRTLIIIVDVLFVISTVFFIFLLIKNSIR